MSVITDAERVTAQPIAYSREVAAEVAGISVAQLDLEVKAGRLRRRKLGRRVLIRHVDLVAWLASLPEAS